MDFLLLQWQATHRTEYRAVNREHRVPLIMPLAFLSFVLIAVHVSVMVDSKPWQHHQDLQTPNPAQTHLSFAPSQTERRASLRSSRQPDFLVILPVKTPSGNFVSIFDLRRKRFLCMDREGELFNARQRNTEDCFFQRLWLDWPDKHDVFYSTRAARLLKFQGADLGIAKQELSEIQADVRHWLLKRMLKRQKRSEEGSLSDPVRPEAHPPQSPMTQREPDQPNVDQSGAVSKETISSCVDPLKVLQTNGPGSPVKSNIGDQAEDAKMV